ncbi:MAG: T9SS C-terminal target domain-containing protein [Methanobacteriota archaeon]|nr:MAG: T9SS C-terminal target domain-containing protein [Euryarchaeota archaeon]
MNRGFVTRIVLAMMLLWASIAMAQVNVTLQLNTATQPDTLMPHHFVEVRGEYHTPDGKTNNLPDGNVIDWNESSTLELTNVGGDYWTITFQMNPGDTLFYKFWTGFDQNTATADGGWEGSFVNDPVTGWDTRVLIIPQGAQDTIVPLQYYNSGATPSVEQYWRPFASKQDSVAIFFRVNLAGALEAAYFNEQDIQVVGVRGDGTTSGGTLDWGSTKVVLTKETYGNIDRKFWSGVAYFPKSAVTEGGQQKYKFFVDTGNDNWENSISDRVFTYPVGLADTTLGWVYFDNKVPTGKQAITSLVTFTVDINGLKALGLFDRAAGDSLFVRGDFNGWGKTALAFNGFTATWGTQIEVTAIPGDPIKFKYYVQWDTSRYNPNSPNYIPNLPDQRVDGGAGWEEPGLYGGGNRSFIFQDAPQQTVPGDFGQGAVYFNTIPEKGIIDQPVAIHLNVDMRPATDPTQNPNPLFDPAQDTVWIQFDNSYFALTQGLAFNGPDARVKLEDLDGDTIYSVTINAQPPFPYQMGFQITYLHTADGSVITNGGGFDAGRRYYRYIHPDNIASDGTITWPTDFTAKTVVWVDGPNCDVEPAPNLFQPTGIEDDNNTITSFDLKQNYPNPFNPTTSIEFTLERPANVELAVFNSLGQKVKTLVNGFVANSKNVVEWDGTNEAGNVVPSGIYFYTLKVGNHSKTMKMVMMK